MPGEILKKIKKLVEENSLAFECEHRTNPKTLLKLDSKRFIQQVLSQLACYEKGDKNILLFEDRQCFDCGEWISYRLEGNKIKPLKQVSCFKEEKVVVELSFPSGEILFADWLEHSTEVLEHLDGDENINALFGRVQRTHNYANEDVAHFFTGTSSPYIYQKGDSLLIGHDQYDEVGNVSEPLDKDFENIGRVSNELRWVTGYDKALYRERLIKKYGETVGEQRLKEATELAHVVVNVTPGRYKLTYYTKQEANRELYAAIEKIDKK